jgi:hypothetical protein
VLLDAQGTPRCSGLRIEMEEPTEEVLEMGMDLNHRFCYPALHFQETVKQIEDMVRHCEIYDLIDREAWELALVWTQTVRLRNHILMIVDQFG